MRRVILFLFFFFSFCSLFATHNRSGEITFRQISLLTYEIKIVTYTKATSIKADRQTLPIHWGDNTSDTLNRTGSGIILEGDIKKNEYIGVHTYPGAGTYKINFEDPNRNAGVLNLGANSDAIPFYIETLLEINSFYAYNNSPVLLQPPIDKGKAYVKFIHNPNAYDQDGDSLSYQLIPCKGAGGLPIPGYQDPTASNNIFRIDAFTGDLIWDAPTAIGEYNVAIKINEWRRFDNSGKRLSKPHLIGYVIRDLQIEIESTSNHPPVLVNIKDTCVTAGDSLNFIVTATDIDNDSITLYASGGVFQLSPKAKFTSFPAAGLVSGSFKWGTDCAHIRQQAYQVVFKAEDDHWQVNLSDMKSMRIRVVAPAPKNLIVNAAGNSMQLQWEKEICPQALGYRIYRRDGPSGFNPTVCETGLPAYTGFELIDQIQDINSISYTDTDKGAGLIPGVKYCYRVVAYFAENVESYASNESCDELKKDVPVMTLASVLSTSAINGNVSLRWSKPVASVLDTNQNKGPYIYELYRSGTSLPIKTSLSQNFKNFNDTTFIDTGANTVDTSNSYYIKFYTESVILKGNATSASTIFLSISATDNQLDLSWKYKAPWKNYIYYVYKKNALNVFELIDSTSDTQYSDTGLVNGDSYCYYIEGKGRLSGEGFPDPIINKSQERCGIPIDNIPPCAPILLVTPNCEQFQNQLKWDNLNLVCSDDVWKYRVFKILSRNAQWEQAFDSVSPASPSAQIEYYHTNLTQSIAGCYSITAVDSAGNESARSNAVCVDNCPSYALPNIFTPNGDTYNDFFFAMPGSKFTQKIDIKIFDRWGVLMFQSADPEFKWDGRNIANGRDCAEGTYFYVCEIYELRLDDVTKRTINGFVELLRSTRKNPQNSN